MPAARAASSREAPSSTSARASIRRAARASRHRAASRRRSPAPGSCRVIAIVIRALPCRRPTTDQPRRAPRGSGRDNTSGIQAVGISSIELARRLGVRQPTAWLVKHKLMRAMAAREAAKPKLAGRVEIDDAYLGGERPGGKRGRGAAGKTPVVAAVGTTAERRPKRLRLTVVKGFRKREVEKLAKAAIEPGATVVTDGLSCWPAVEKAGCRHFPIVTGSGKRAAGWTPFRWVNTTLGNVKTALAGAYHHVSPKHAQSYLTSFAYRFNRRFQLDSIVERLAWAADHTNPQPYHTVIADA